MRQPGEVGPRRCPEVFVGVIDDLHKVTIDGCAVGGAGGDAQHEDIVNVENVRAYLIQHAAQYEVLVDDLGQHRAPLGQRRASISTDGESATCPDPQRVC